MKVFIVASNTDVTLLVKANDAENAILKANLECLRSYGFELDNPTAYEIEDYVEDEPMFISFP